MLKKANFKLYLSEQLQGLGIGPLKLVVDSRTAGVTRFRVYPKKQPSKYTLLQVTQLHHRILSVRFSELYFTITFRGTISQLRKPKKTTPRLFRLEGNTFKPLEVGDTFVSEKYRGNFGGIFKVLRLGAEKLVSCCITTGRKILFTYPKLNKEVLVQHVR
jgi:hypothetical protein